MSALCIIPARGGSRRIPRKNIRSFLGRPIISYVIDVARECGCFDEIMVSTDDAEIAATAGTCGAQVPFLRSPETSHDYAGTMEVILEVAAAYRARGRTFDSCCCLYPTAVLSRPESLREGFQRLTEDPTASCVVPVLPFSYPIQRAVRVENGRMPMFQPEHYRSRSQDLPRAYHDAGQWYWLNTAQLCADMTLLGPDSIPIVLNEMDAQDIDNEDDWQLAELKYRMRQHRENAAAAESGLSP